MPGPITTIARTARTLYRVAGWVYLLVNELVTERKNEEKALAHARRVMSQRYQDASNTAGKSHSPYKGQIVPPKDPSQ